MEELEEDFTPDFTFLSTTGETSNRGSLVKQVNGLAYISVNNQINIWNIRFSEILRTVCGIKKKITSFDHSDGVLVIGYENGIVQIHSDRVLSFRPHSKRVVRIVKAEDYVISASADSSVILYDLVTGEIAVKFEGNGACVDDIVVYSHRIFAICTDNTLKVWDIRDKHVRSVHVFKKPLKGVTIEGTSAILFFKDGECIFYDLEEKSGHHFIKFKKLRNIKREGRKLFVQCKSKLHVYEIDMKESIVLRNLEVISSSDRYVDFDIMPGCGFIFVTNENCWELVKDGKTYSFGCHRSEILDFEVREGRLVTFSRDKIIFWNLEDVKIERAGSIQIKDGDKMCLWNDNIVVGGIFGFACYSILSYDLILEEGIGTVSAVCSNENELAIGKDNTVLFYNKNYKVVRTLETDENVCSMGMSAKCSILCVGLLDCKVYVYDLDSLTLKVVLYGHSLPVRSMGISPDGLELLTCGADKLLKMWGIQFGECRKTFVGDARNVEYLNKSLFMFSSGKIQYFRRYDKLKEFRHSNSNIVKVRDDLLVSCGKFNIDVYRMDKYEFQGGESSDEEEEVLKVMKIVNHKKYDEFLLGLERLSEEFSDDNIGSFFKILAEIDFCELDKFLCLLSAFDIAQIMSVLDVCNDRNIILTARVFASLIRLHKEICVSHIRFKHMLKAITEKVNEIRDEIGMNEGKLLVGRSIDREEVNGNLMFSI